MTAQTVALITAGAVAFGYIYRKGAFDFIRARIEKGKEILKYASPYDPYILTVSEKYGVDPKVSKAVLYWESELDPRKVSPAGAYGLAQFVRDTWNWVWKNIIGSTPRAITDPYSQIEAFGAYMKYLLNRFNGSYIHALSAYNMGPTKTEKLMSMYPDTSSFIKALPFETKAYVYAITELIPYVKV
jgi:soluble lytic murein transglycosylase